jgi:hypothetical protein
MQRSLTNERSAGNTRRDMILLPKPILKALTGATCASCGSRHYHLVLSAGVRSHEAVLTARCSRCREPRQGLSEHRLMRDIERATRMPFAGFSEWQTR